MIDPSEVKILVVDDTEAARYATVRLLRRAGYTVADTPSGEIALNCVARNGFDLVILDIKLLDISGFDVCRQITPTSWCSSSRPPTSPPATG